MNNFLVPLRTFIVIMILAHIAIAAAVEGIIVAIRRRKKRKAEAAAAAADGEKVEAGDEVEKDGNYSYVIHRYHIWGKNKHQ